MTAWVICAPACACSAELRGGAFVLRRFDRARAQPREQHRNGAACQQSDDLGQAETAVPVAA